MIGDDDLEWQDDETRPGEEAVEHFLSQPASSYAEDVESVQEFHDVRSDVTMTFVQRLTAFLFEKRSSGYSSNSPRTSDGSRTKITFFNGNGRSR